MRIIVNQVVTANAYTAGMAVGGKISLPDIGAPLKCVITGVSLIDKAAQAHAYNLVFFAADLVGTVTDRQVFNLHDSDRTKLLGFVPLNNSCSLGTGGLLTRASNIYERLTLTGRIGYAVLLTAGTPTYTSTSDVSIQITSERVMA